MIQEIKKILQEIDKLPLEEKIETLNNIKLEMKEISPFKNEPVDCVIWVKNENIKANDYNPNKVAPPEMTLLEISISNDGYTQPIVTFEEDDKYTVIDGFHRSRVAKESKLVQERIYGYAPITLIKDSQKDRNNRIASTIRHNRARGKHTIDAMSDIVIELKNRNWKNERIARELGMDEEEVLRLCQITGLEDIFKDDDFSRAWEIEGYSDDFVPLDDFVTEEEKEENDFRTINTSDPTRIFHTYEKWECHKAGFYKNNFEGKKREECEQIFASVLSNLEMFEKNLQAVTTEWVNSCEHYLTNTAMNRIAWLGQASVCYATGIPAVYSSGWGLLTEEQQQKANELALVYLNKWLKEHEREILSMEQALSVGRQVAIY
jgi:ParB-like chromosome segregation protein Spo0J